MKRNYLQYLSEEYSIREFSNEYMAMISTRFHCDVNDNRPSRIIIKCSNSAAVPPGAFPIRGLFFYKKRRKRGKGGTEHMSM